MRLSSSLGALDEWLSQRSAKPSTAVRIRHAPLLISFFRLIIQRGHVAVMLHAFFVFAPLSGGSNLVARLVVGRCIAELLPEQVAQVDALVQLPVAVAYGEDRRDGHECITDRGVGNE